MTEIPSTVIRFEPTAPPPPPSAEPAPETISDAAPPASETSDADSAPEGAAGKDKPRVEPPTAEETTMLREARKRLEKVTRREVENGKRHESLTQREAALADGAKRNEARAAQLEEAAKLIDADPIAYLTKHKGWREEDIARRFLGDGKPSPQEADHRREEAFRLELGKRDESIARLEKLLEEHVVRPRQADEAKATEAKTIADYKGFVTQQAAKYPSLSRALAADAESVMGLVDATALQVIQANQRPNDRDAFWHLVAERVNTRLAKISGSPLEPTAADADTKGTESQGRQGQEADSKVAPTLSGKGSAQRATMSVEDLFELQHKDPAAFRKLTLERARKAKSAG